MFIVFLIKFIVFKYIRKFEEIRALILPKFENYDFLEEKKLFLYNLMIVTNF